MTEPRRLCEECSGVLEGPPSVVARRRWCSWECRTAEPRNFKAWGSETRICAMCGEEFSCQRSSSKVCCSSACGHKYAGLNSRKDKVRKQCLHCGSDYYKYPSQANRSKYCSRNCQVLGRPIAKSSKIADLAIELWARSSNAEYVQELRVGRYAIDLALPQARIAIELDGEYWHSLPEMVAKDAKKTAKLKSEGWTVIRVVIQRRHTAGEVAILIHEALRDPHSWSHQLEMAI